MARVIEMPKLSDTMEEGGIANWLKKEGEPIGEGEALVEIETDKATQEYESPEEGVVLKILVTPGKTVPLRTPIAVIGEKGETVDLDALTGNKKSGQAPKASPTSSTNIVDLPVKKDSSGKPDQAYAPQGSAAKAPSPRDASEGGRLGSEDTGRLRSSPLARKVAEERGIDLGQITGSGPNGRIVLRDLDSATAEPTRPESSQPALASDSSQVLTTPVSMMRKTIAKRLTAAKNEAPHFYLTVSAQVAELENWRRQLNDEAAKSDGKLAKVSLNDCVTLAVARALRKHPTVNSSWQGDSILTHRDVHVAIAVALPEGLVTPVIRRTDVLGVREIASEARELATKAKEGKLGNDAYVGGTFTISNLGMFGIEEFTAIINPPQAAILAVGAALAVPWVDKRGQLSIEQRMKMTMSCDHRVVDGATGAQFLKTLVTFLEEPMRMMV